MVKISNNNDDEENISESLNIEEELVEEKPDDIENKLEVEIKSDTDSSGIFEEETPGRKSVFIGAWGERGFMDAANNNEEFQDHLRECFKKFGLNYDGEISAYKESKEKKTDIVVNVGETSIGTNIKTTTTRSNLGVDKRWLEVWKEKLSIPETIYDIMKDGILRKAREGKPGKFILEEDREIIENFFIAKKEEIVRDLLTKNEENLDVMVINDAQKKKYYLYKMDDFINFLDDNMSDNTTLSNIGYPWLGDFIKMQRKSGDGNRKEYPKTDYRHPSNMIQFKITPVQCAEYIEKNNLLKSHIIDYKL